MMPAGGVLIAILAGWGLSKAATLDELQMEDGLSYKAWRVLVRFVVPAAIGLVFIANI
jgi:NSS family neurotransmitter:Na+ symporter